MLGEIAITPDVFRESSFSDAIAAALAWERLREPVLHESMVRDLYDGAWFRELMLPTVTLSPKGKELLKKIARRLHKAPKCGAACPTDDAGWCDEALRSATAIPLDCVVTTKATKVLHTQDRIVASADTVAAHNWWTSRSNSIRLKRTTQDYITALDRLLAASNSLMFIDPHLDPSQRRYGQFFQLLARAVRVAAPPRIELHRVCCVGSGPKATLVSPADWEKLFKTHLLPQLAGMSLRVEVFIWDNFHDRYLLSDLMGILLPYGFDISNAANTLTTWTRLGLKDRDDVQREFDPACQRHNLKHRFPLLP